MLLSLKFNKKKDFTQKGVIVKSLGVLKNTVNATKVGLLALNCVFVKDARIVRGYQKKRKNNQKRLLKWIFQQSVSLLISLWGRMRILLPFQKNKRLVELDHNLRRRVSMKRKRKIQERMTRWIPSKSKIYQKIIYLNLEREMEKKILNFKNNALSLLEVVRNSNNLIKELSEHVWSYVFLNLL